MRIESVFLLSATLWAQPAFQNLAPTGDGSTVYFSSSLRIRGTNQYPSQPKIFVWNEKSGVQLYEQKTPTITGPLPYWGSSTAYNLIAPSISSDGRTIAITGLSDCTFGESCAFEIHRYQAEIHVAGSAPLVMDGVPAVSPNGRFAALGPTVIHPLTNRESTVLDLSTGQRQDMVNSAGFSLHHGVANDGTVVLDDSELGVIQLWRWPGATVPLNVSSIGPLLIDATAARVFYQVFDRVSPGTMIDLMTLDVSAGTATELAAVTAASIAPVPFEISDNGSLAAFVQLGQAWIVRGDGTGRLQVTNVQDPIVEIALSGSGSHLFAITGASRVLRVDLATLAVEEIIPATPIASGLYFRLGILSPGGLAEIVSSTQPIPEIQSISLLGFDLPIFSAGQNVIEVEVPYGIPEGIAGPDAVLKQQSSGPFESAMLWVSPAEVSDYDPSWYVVNNHLAALHQDFSGSITAEKPAHPGEIVHAYGSGFGPVAPQPPLGQPASANPLSRTTTPFICGLRGDDSKLVPADILFAGLAPGWIALYQFDVRLPARPAGIDTYLVCGKKDDPAVSLLPMAEK